MDPELIEYTHDYEIAEGKNPTELKAAVKKLLVKEFEPDGDIIVFNGPDGLLLLQKMVQMDVMEDEDEEA